MDESDVFKNCDRLRADGIITESEWMLLAPVKAAFEALKELDAGGRLMVLREFCRGCGCDDPSCQCQNDD